MSALIDQPARDRFEKGHDVNISVIAPAGVGKTTAIVNRIVHLARLPEAEAVERLQRLVVVTYSCLLYTSKSEADRHSDAEPGRELLPPQPSR